RPSLVRRNGSRIASPPNGQRVRRAPRFVAESSTRHGTGGAVMKKRIAVIGCALFLASASRAGAQIDTSGTWRFSVTPYGWALSLHGRVGVGPVAANADVSFRDLLKTLRFGIMAEAEARHGRLFGDIDVIYASLGKTNVVAFRGDTGTLELTGKLAII